MVETFMRAGGRRKDMRAGGRITQTFPRETLPFNDFRNAVIKTVDTDVITLLLAHLSLLKIEIEADFNFEKERRLYKINDVCSRITPEKQLALMFLFIFTSCFLTY